MHRYIAKRIAETITPQQLLETFQRAKAGIKDWEKPSIVNKGLTKGVAWNILAKDFDLSKKYHHMAITNMVREFAAFLPPELIPPKKTKPNITASHQDPDFTDWP